MNLQKLFEIQAELDKRIVENKWLQGQDLLDKKILALQVELGELANELPEYFKFWSNKKNNYKKALEEYCDCLHFILSIGNDLGVNEISDRHGITKINGSKTDQLTYQFLAISHNATDLYNTNKQAKELVPDHYSVIFKHLLKIGELLGFTWKQIEQAYLDKNKINHERQENGY